MPQFFIADCKCVLGRVLARRGQDAEAEAAFIAAADLAREARMPLLELISGRDLKRSIPALAEKADSIIDAACARMETGRGDFESLLSRS